MSEEAEIKKTILLGEKRDKRNRVERIVDFFDRDVPGFNLLIHLAYHLSRQEHHYCETVDRYEPGAKETCQLCNKR